MRSGGEEYRFWLERVDRARDSPNDRSSAFEIATASDLARRYNDISVNESNHAACGFDAVERCGLLAALEPAERKEFRKLFLAAILATDSAITHWTRLSPCFFCFISSPSHSG